MTFPLLARGSVVEFEVGGSRSTGGQPVTIPAIVLGQDPDDGMVSLFCFHFEGQYHTRAKATSLKVLFDAAFNAGQECGINSAMIQAVRQELEDLRETLASDLKTVQRNMQEMQVSFLNKDLPQTAIFYPDPENKEPGFIVDLSSEFNPLKAAVEAEKRLNEELRARKAPAVR